MNHKQKVGFRATTLVGLMLITQCCCCIIPLGWQVQQGSPTVRQFIERVERIQMEISQTIDGFVLLPK